MNGSEFSLPPSFDVKAFKAEILKEMRSEISKAKNEIIDGECLVSLSARDVSVAVNHQKNVCLLEKITFETLMNNR